MLSSSIANLAMIEELYGKYLKDPQSVDSSWRHFFQGMDFGSDAYPKASKDEVVTAFRHYGHLMAKINPLVENPSPVKQLDYPNADKWKKIYCGSIGYEYMDLGRPELEKWMQEKIEKGTSDISPEERRLLLETLTKAEAFENFIHTKYPGQTRFSLEGAETMIPILAEILEASSAEEALIGMAHRGRLNVLTSILNKSTGAIFEEFEDDTALSSMGNDDVKYHMGAVGEWRCRSGRVIKVEMAANPSHLESVNAVVLGGVHAKQKKTQALPILIHGDASLAGQGVIYEALQMMNLPSYSVGGAVHLVINNQIGYTTLPQEGRSTRYCTDIAKAFGIPVFHVNAEDPESCLFVAKLALEIRQTFHCDVFIDLVCYRKYGHNEGDEPSFTQPVQYNLIRQKASIGKLYREHLARLGMDGLEKPVEFSKEKKSSVPAVKENGSLLPPPSMRDLEETLTSFCRIPEGFHLHSKLEKWLSNRAACLKGQIDWSSAECLAFGTLLKQGIPIRLAGQDAQRGTFSQRHMVWIDTETGNPYNPLGEKGEIVNSPLTEYAGMGFEYGYSVQDKRTLVLWEAQYGDFDNGAQIIIDQYIASGEQKWNVLSSLTLLLPHGYEGAGPEHSSARPERFLQLAANDNMQIVNASTPAQYFHVLRRQVHTKKPLILFTPKSLLRNPACTSKVEDLLQGSFQPVLDDTKTSAKRLLFCSGKIFYELMAACKRDDVAIIRIEQLYPLPKNEIRKVLEKYKGYAELFWVQEEPENMGAFRYIAQHLPNAVYVGRAANATTATGSSRKSKAEQAEIITRAFA